MVAKPAFHIKERTIRVQDGLRLFVRDWMPVGQEKRRTILCLPGLARNSRDFDVLAEHYVQRGHRVVCPDYRGRGRSAYDPDWRNYRPEQYIDDLRHILCALQTGPVVSIGTSMGALLTMAMGVAMPTMLKAAVINDAGPDIEGSGLSRIVDYLSTDPQYADWDTTIAALKRMMPDLNPGPGDTAGAEDWRRIAEAAYIVGDDGHIHPDWDPKIAESLKRGAPIPDLWPYFESLRRLPVLVIRGGKSDILSAGTLEKMAEAHPHLSALTLMAKGHAPTLDETESLEAIDALLANADGE